MFCIRSAARAVEKCAFPENAQAASLRAKENISFDYSSNHLGYMRLLFSVQTANLVVAAISRRWA